MLNLIVFNLARILSLVFHPVLLFLPLPYLLVIHTTNSITEAVRWTFFSWIFLFCLVVFIYYQVRIGKFTNFDVSKREQRPLLFFYLAVISIIYILLLLLLHGPFAMVVVTIGIFIGLLALDLINMRIKASIHVATVASILLAFVILNGGAYVWVLLLIPFVAWSRIRLHRHSLAETITGAFFGFFLTGFMYVMIEYAFRI